MSKYRITRKEIKGRFKNDVYAIGYCDLQHLLFFRKPFAYSTRSEGWACDYYLVGEFCLSTGYASIGKGIDKNLIKKYDNEAKFVIKTLPIEEAKEKIDELLSKFYIELIKLSGEEKNRNC